MIKKILIVIGSILASLAAGGIGSLANISNIPTWYAGLDKPLLTPPNWVFGPVWTTLYFAMGVALAIIILKSTPASKKWAYIWFGVQLALNTLWSLVFFGLHAPWAGVVIILALITAIILTMREFKKISTASAWLLVPYLAWVCFATYLTVSIAILNP